MALRAHEHGIKERRNLESQMLETMQMNSVAQSRQFEEAVVTQRNQLENVAQREAESSRLQLQSWQARFAEVSAQQNLRVNILENMLKEAENRDRTHQKQMFELRTEGQECAQLLKNAERGMYGFQGEAMASGRREEAQRAELIASLQDLERTRTIVKGLMTEMVASRAEQASSNQTSE